MSEAFSRTELLIGTKSMDKLKNSHIAIFGLGGVGGYALEGLVRSGIEHFDLFDNDTLSISNLNRQILATYDSIGVNKTDAALNRALSINPNVKINLHSIFYSSKNSNDFDFKKYDYIVDAIDTVSSKIELIANAQIVNTPIISCMGTGNKLNPSMLEVSDIYKTSVCPLAKVMRYELRKRGIKKLKVVYSKEDPIKPIVQNEEFGRHIPASSVFVPSAAGMLIASEVFNDLLKKIDKA